MHDHAQVKSLILYVSSKPRRMLFSDPHLQVVKPIPLSLVNTITTLWDSSHSLRYGTRSWEIGKGYMLWIQQVHKSMYSNDIEHLATLNLNSLHFNATLWCIPSCISFSPMMWAFNCKIDLENDLALVVTWHLWTHACISYMKIP